MTRRLVLRVSGTPAPQGSKRHVGNGVMVESSAKVKPWRQDVKHAAMEVLPQPWSPLLGPVRLVARFYLTRPKGHYGTGRNAGVVKASAPEWPAVKPDVDKLLRSTMDALGEAGVWRDDSQVVVTDMSKSYAPTAGAYLEVWSL